MPIRIVALTESEPSGPSARLTFVASDPAGHPVGSATVRLLTGVGVAHLAELTVAVHPADRRHGTGTRLLAEAVEAARADGRRSLLTQAEAGTPGQAFLDRHDFRPVLTLTYARLDLASVDSSALVAEIARPRPGYRLISWYGLVPDDLLDTFVASRRAMDDMPMDDTDYGVTLWDAARVRSVVAAVEKRGDILQTVAAVAEADGSIAGFTELVIPGTGTGDGQHYGTGVLPEHRGHGLAEWMKTEAIRAAATDYPDVARLLADTADSNTFMRRINDRLGYVPTHKSIEYQLDLQALS